jgi:hypothetical protein
VAVKISVVNAINRLGEEYFSSTPERQAAITKELKERFSVDPPSEPGLIYQPVVDNVWAWSWPRAGVADDPNYEPG